MPGKSIEQYGKQKEALRPALNAFLKEYQPYHQWHNSGKIFGEVNKSYIHNVNQYKSFRNQYKKVFEPHFGALPQAAGFNYANKRAAGFKAGQTKLENKKIALKEAQSAKYRAQNTAATALNAFSHGLNSTFKGGHS